MDFRFRTSFTGEPVDQEKNKKFWSPQINLATHSKKTFVDIWYGLEENDGVG
jgi:hypothetical protein